jgi:hypothetical protein
MLNGGANPDERLNAAGASYGLTTGGLVLLDPRSWTKPAPPRLWNVPDWVPRGVVTSLYGDGGIGKTLLAQQLDTSRNPPALADEGGLRLPGRQ